MNTEEILNKIIVKFEKQGYCQVDGYNRFGFKSNYENGVIITREKGKDTHISNDMLKKGINAIKENPDVYLD